MNNGDDINQLIKRLQKKVNQDQKKYYSETVINEFNNPTQLRKILHPDATAKITGPCGDTLQIELAITNGIIVDACFWTDGCGATIASTNMLLKTIKGKSLEEVEKITPIQLLKLLDGLPKEHQHCAKLAVNTLQYAIAAYSIKK